MPNLDSSEKKRHRTRPIPRKKMKISTKTKPFIVDLGRQCRQSGRSFLVSGIVWWNPPAGYLAHRLV